MQIKQGQGPETVWCLVLCVVRCCQCIERPGSIVPIKYTTHTLSNSRSLVSRHSAESRHKQICCYECGCSGAGGGGGRGFNCLFNAGLVVGTQHQGRQLAKLLVSLA